jgi:hypothetical protein
MSDLSAIWVLNFSESKDKWSIWIEKFSGKDRKVSTKNGKEVAQIESNPHGQVI